MRRAAVLLFWVVGCAGPRPASDAAREDAAREDAAVPGDDAAVVHDDGGAPVDAPSDAWSIDAGRDANVRTLCSLADGHACTRWAHTEPDGDDACLGYDGLGVTCSNDPSSGHCDVGSGHTCARWLRTDPNGEWACLGYDGFGTTCDGTPGATCDVGSGHSCARWARTEPDGDWACLGYDGLGTICE